MGRITSSIGLASGIPIAETVDKLLALKARPRDLLVKRTEQLRAEQVAITELTALVVGVEFAFKALGSNELFRRQEVRSSKESLLTAAITGTPSRGTWQFTPVQQAQRHQLLSSGVASTSAALGGGEVAIRFGGFVDRGISLSELNGGAGVERGRIRISDRGGNSEIIDVRFAQTIDDVLTAINRAENIQVTAVADGDRIKLMDNTGLTAANLRVQEVGTGRTAADLGLAGINVAADEASGADILQLHRGLKLASLNDGMGVELRSGVADLEVNLRDGTALQIDFRAQIKGPTPSTATTQAANGLNAQVQFTSVGSGEAFDGYQVRFQDDPSVTAGRERVAINTSTKTITFRIDAGSTRAADVVTALNNDAVASGIFTAELAEGSNGTGIVAVTDTATSSGGAVQHRNETTLGDLLDTINAADPARLSARISAAGDQIELIDLTSGAETFAVHSAFGGRVAEQLGLNQPAVDDVISGQRRLAGLKTVLLDSLAGGSGFGSLGLLDLTDRSGASASVDLSAAKTLSDVIAAINAAGTGIRARVNDARNGLALVDHSGGQGNLVIANGDGTNTADRLRITTNDAVAAANSGSLDLQAVHRQTLLSSLHQGRGVGDGSFLITDSQGRVGAVNFGVSKPKTVGDVIDLINGLNIGVEARINASGDGLLLVDTAGGSGTLKVADSGNRTTAQSLRIAGTATLQDLNGTPTQVIDGSMALRVTLSEGETLKHLVDKINAQNAGVTAGIFNAGGGTSPFRLTLTSGVDGSAGELLVDASPLGLVFQETAAAQDALLLVGDANRPLTTALVTSPNDIFNELIDGVRLQMRGASAEPVTISIDQTDEPLVKQIGLLVTQYNKLREKIDAQTAFDATTQATGILFGSRETLRIESELTTLLTARFFGLGKFQSLQELGLRLNEQGKLEFDAAEFRNRLAEDPEAVERFFTDPDRGLAVRFAAAAQRLAGIGDSALVGRSSALQTSIDNSVARIQTLNQSLARQRESLLNEFYRLEESLARLQSGLSAIQQIQILQPLTRTRN